MRGNRIWMHALPAAVVAFALAAGTAVAAARPATARPGAVAVRAAAPQSAAQLERRVKAALSRYQSVDAAKAAGYAMASPCEFTPTSPGASWWSGAMGVHFVNNQLLQQPLNPLKPAILVYLPTAGGGFKLVAAEYFKADADQNVKTDSDRPALFGRSFDGPMLGHAPGMPIHYDLHVWLWQHNPAGIFAPYNPDASCTP